MTNEELAVLIQAGQQELMAQLWEQTERFIKMMAARLVRKLKPCNGVGFDDLVQSGYLALVEAAKRFDIERGFSFLTLLRLTLKGAFAECAGYRREAQKNNPLNGEFTASMDAPFNKEADSTLHDITSNDPKPFHDSETDIRIFHEQLHEAVEDVFAMIGPEYSEVLKKRFFEGQTLKQISDKDGRSPERIRQLEAQALRRTRGAKCSRILQPFYLELRTPYFLRVGPRRFQNTGSSSVEEIMLIRERIMGQMQSNQVRGGEVQI